MLSAQDLTNLEQLSFSLIKLVKILVLSWKRSTIEAFWYFGLKSERFQFSLLSCKFTELLGSTWCTLKLMLRISLIFLEFRGNYYYILTLFFRFSFLIFWNFCISNYFKNISYFKPPWYTTTRVKSHFNLFLRTLIGDWLWKSKYIFTIFWLYVFDFQLLINQGIRLWLFQSVFKMNLHIENVFIRFPHKYSHLYLLTIQNK